MGKKPHTARQHDWLPRVTQARHRVRLLRMQPRSRERSTIETDRTIPAPRMGQDGGVVRRWGEIVGEGRSGTIITCRVMEPLVLPRPAAMVFTPTGPE